MYTGLYWKRLGNWSSSLWNMLSVGRRKLEIDFSLKIQQPVSSFLALLEKPDYVPLSLFFILSLHPDGLQIRRYPNGSATRPGWSVIPSSTCLCSQGQGPPTPTHCSRGRLLLCHLALSGVPQQDHHEWIRLWISSFHYLVSTGCRLGSITHLGSSRQNVSWGSYTVCLGYHDDGSNFGTTGLSNKLFSIIPPYEFDTNIAKRVAPLTFVYVMMLALNNLCLKYVEVTFYQVWKERDTQWMIEKRGPTSYIFIGCTISFNQLYHPLYLPHPRQNYICSCIGRLYHCILWICYWILWRNQLFMGWYLLWCRLFCICRTLWHLRPKDLVRGG